MTRHSLSYHPPSWQSDAGRREVGVLVGLGLISIVLWSTPFGAYLLYPFSILATWFHEMGHGLAAMIGGNVFHSLVIFPDGSGYAAYFTYGEMSRLEQAGIAAIGLLGPTLAGCALILAAQSRASTKAALLLLGVALLVSCLIWVRSLTGWLVLPAIGAICLYMAVRARQDHQRFAVQFLGVQGCISIYRDFGYLFNKGGVLNGQQQLSDTGYIAQALVLPYWFWGGMISALMVIMVFWCLKRVHTR